jgi:hypothetical protein
MSLPLGDEILVNPLNSTEIPQPPQNKPDISQRKVAFHLAQFTKIELERKKAANEAALFF